MPERDRAAIYIESIQIEFADGLIAIEFAMGKVARSHCLTTGQDLSSECLIDLDEFKVRDPQAGLLKEFVDGEHGSETHAAADRNRPVRRHEHSRAVRDP